MRKLFYVLGFSLIIMGCSSIKNIDKDKLDYGSPNIKQELVNDMMFLIKEYTDDKTYGYTKENPIMVGKEGGGPKDQRRFLYALAGPNGEEISFERRGSCCHFYTKNGIFDDSGLLDMYEITYEGLEEPLILYINLYDSDVLKVPVGFTLKE